MLSRSISPICQGVVGDIMEEEGKVEKLKQTQCRKYAEHEIPHLKCSLGGHPFFDCKLDDFERVFF